MKNVLFRSSFKALLRTPFGRRRRLRLVFRTGPASGVSRAEGYGNTPPEAGGTPATPTTVLKLPL
ncbi:MAG: hypothetical protein IPK21_13725 [Haliscomenobacter sp.]|nr:hypothetical protein [Haliscomenobacter sp.]